MRRWTRVLLLLFLGIVNDGPAVAQSPSASLAGEWRTGNRVVVIEQDGHKLRGSWKEAYRDKYQTCSGVWFEGTIADDHVSGSRYLCGGGREPLNIKIVNANRLEVIALAHGKTPTTINLRRIK
jgi:hypothetical protein